MKKLIVVTLCLLFASIGYAEVAPADTSSTIAQLFGNPLVQAAILALLIAVLDLLFALNPKWKSNGTLHFVYLGLLKLAGKKLE